MADPCLTALLAAPAVNSHDGWIWSRSNPPRQVNPHLPGKWMLFPSCGEAAATWASVAAAGQAGHVWLAKIAPRATRSGHLICIYTPDFTDLASVEASARLLNELGLVQRTIYYKPDVFTYAGIYSQRGQTGAGGASVYAYVPAQGRVQTMAGLRRALELTSSRGKAGAW